MPPLISREEALRLGELADVVSRPLISSARSDREVRLSDPSMQLRYARERARAVTP